MNKQKILFLCTGNSCRSQMAEGWGNHLSADVYTFYSAGIKTHGLNPGAVRVMKESGVDISSHYSKTVDAIPIKEIDMVFTVCGHADETCPVFSKGCKIIHVGFDDPPKLAETASTEQEALSHYRKVRDEIKHFIISLDEYINPIH